MTKLWIALASFVAPLAAQAWAEPLVLVCYGKTQSFKVNFHNPETMKGELTVLATSTRISFDQRVVSTTKTSPSASVLEMKNNGNVIGVLTLISHPIVASGQILGQSVTCESDKLARPL